MLPSPLAALLQGAWLLAASSAPAQILLPGTQPGDLVNWPLRGPGYCLECHGRYSPETYEPWDTWGGAMMANASRDPLFWAAVDIANQDMPGVGELCIRCHAPRTWLAGRGSAPDGSAFLGSPGVPGGDFEGIDCGFCHRLVEGPGPGPTLDSGQYWVDDGTPEAEPPYRGPRDDAGAPHAWTYSDLHRSSALCAVCHNLRNPMVHLVDENGADLGIAFPAQLTYDEWARSRFPGEGIECQSCHMAPVPGYASTDLSPARDVARHDLAGANAWMRSLLNDLHGESLGRSADYEAGINFALDLLQDRAADLVLSAPSRLAPGREAVIRVRVVNLTGHKLPTGMPVGRRMWLQVIVTDGLGGVLFETGRYDAATATLIPDDELHLYETVHGIHGQGPGFHLVLDNRIYKDTRIPPAGFVPDVSTMPVGITFEALPDGSLANWDTAEFPVLIPEGTPSPVTVTASLYYQTVTREFVEFLRDENVSGPDPHDPDPGAPNRGEKILAHWESSGRCPPVLMETRTRTIRTDLAPPVSRPAPEPRDGIPPVPWLGSVRPNPLRDGADVEYSLPAGAEVRLRVFDVAGRRVRVLDAGWREAGRHEIRWDGRDDAGRPVATGTYFLRLELPGHAPQVKRALVMRP